MFITNATQQGNSPCKKWAVNIPGGLDFPMFWGVGANCNSKVKVFTQLFLIKLEQLLGV